MTARIEEITEKVPQYRFEFQIRDANNDEVVASGGTYMSTIREDELGLISCESAEQELFSALRAFHDKLRAQYEAENYPQEETPE